jgi:hypothetical protein
MNSCQETLDFYKGNIERNLKAQLIGSNCSGVEKNANYEEIKRDIESFNTLCPQQNIANVILDNSGQTILHYLAKQRYCRYKHQINSIINLQPELDFI